MDETREMNMLQSTLLNHARLVEKVLEDERFLGKAVEAGHLMVKTLSEGNKILVCGNGGSAADAQHIAAELVGRFRAERRALPCIALTCNSSTVTAWANDYAYEDVFARQVEAFGRPDDLLIAITTSGNSKNVVNAVKAASEAGLATVGLLGGDGGVLATMVDVAVIVPDETTARVQEVHQVIYHAWCSMIDAALANI